MKTCDHETPGGCTRCPHCRNNAADADGVVCHCSPQHIAIGDLVRVNDRGSVYRVTELRDESGTYAAITPISGLASPRIVRTAHLTKENI